MSRSTLRTAALTAAALFLFSAASFGRQPFGSESPDPTGKYQLSGGGYLVVSVDDTGRAEGFFERNGEFGRLSGRLESGVVSAAWVQQNGPIACTTAVDGSLHWGRVRLTRTETGDLEAAWSACQGAPAQLETAR
jgi:hypothetical protein